MCDKNCTKNRMFKRALRSAKCGSGRKDKAGWYLYLIVPFWYASAAYQASLVEPWFVFWRDVVEPKYPWWDQTSLICCRSVPKKVRLGIHRTQIRSKIRLLFFSYRDQSGVVERHVFRHFSGRQYSSPTPHLPFYLILLFRVSFSESWKSKFRKKFGKPGSILKPKKFQRCP